MDLMIWWLYGFYMGIWYDFIWILSGDLIWFDDVDAIWCHETRVLPPGLHPDAILGDGNEEEVSRELRTEEGLFGGSKPRRHVKVQKAWTSWHLKSSWPENWPGFMGLMALMQEFDVIFLVRAWILHREVLNLWLFENQMMPREGAGKAGFFRARQFFVGTAVKSDAGDLRL